MMYESPVKLFLGEIKHQVDEQMEEACYTAVIEYFPHVDRAELLRALEYDRQQYDVGYVDGKQFAMESLVHCGECIQWRALSGIMADYGHCHYYYCTKHNNGFCDRGERRTEDDG